MKVEVRFDVRDEFEMPLGDMMGDVELASKPTKGDRIDIAPSCGALKDLGLPDMVVVGVEDSDQRSGCVVWLEDLYVQNAEISRPLLRALESELGLFLFPYRPGLE
jgi:hypothetical protein